MQTREYRHLTETETLFWINKPDGEEFIKSSLTELIKEKLAEEKNLSTRSCTIEKRLLGTKKIRSKPVRAISESKFRKS